MHSHMEFPPTLPSSDMDPDADLLDPYTYSYNQQQHAPNQNISDPSIHHKTSIPNDKQPIKQNPHSVSEEQEEIRIENSVAHADKENPTAKAIIAMAHTLGIDPTREFYLLPIAQHALSVPVDSTDTTSRSGEDKTQDLAWFRDMCETERKRYEAVPGVNSPWLRITSSHGSFYYYNFKTFQSSHHPPKVDIKEHHLTEFKRDQSDLDVMRFTSWWTEGNEKRYVHISYYMSAEEFQVNIERDEQMYRVRAIKGKHGPVGCWDLHLKATLNIFGRPTTLMQCDSETRRWLETNAKRLLAVRESLQQKLSKYEMVPSPHVPHIPLVEIHLRSLMKDVARLKTKLATFRPSLANKYAL